MAEQQKCVLCEAESEGRRTLWTDFRIFSDALHNFLVHGGTPPDFCPRHIEEARKYKPTAYTFSKAMEAFLEESRSGKKEGESLPFGDKSFSELMKDIESYLEKHKHLEDQEKPFNKLED